MEKTDEILEQREALLDRVQDFYEAAQHLSERVDQYLVQKCSRSELKVANDALKKLVK